MARDIKVGDHVLAQGAELATVEHIDPPSGNGRILVQVRLDKLPHTLAVPFFLEDLELVDDNRLPPVETADPQVPEP